MNGFGTNFDLSEQEILQLLRELAEEEEMLMYGGEQEMSIVVDRRREKQQLIDAMSEVSLPFYARFVLHIWVSRHHEEWSEIIVRNIRLAERPDRIRNNMCLLAPRGHGKSAWFAYALPLWLGHKIFPGEYGAIVGEGDIAWEHLKHIKRGTPNGDLPGIINTPELAWLKKKGSEGWTKELIILANKTEIFAKGAKSGWRGKHPRWLVVDDFLSQECVHSPTERKRALDNLVGVMLPMVRGPVFIDGTPMHSDDIYYGHCKQEQAFIFVTFPAIKEDDETGEKKALWPERFSVPQLEYIRDHEVGPLVFSREYMCKPISSLSSLFPEELFKPPVIAEDLVLRPSRAWLDKVCTARFIAADIGISANIGADFTLIWVIGLDDKGNRYIIDGLRERGLGFRGIIREFIRLGTKYGVDAGIIESNQAQAFVADEAILQSPFPIDTHQTGPEKHMLERGIPMLRLVFENGKYRLPHGDAYSRKLMRVFIRELQAFTIEDGRVISTARHDDTVMAAWLLEMLLRKMNFGGAWFDQEATDKEGYEEHWGATEEEDTEETERQPSLYDKEMTESFGTIYRGPISPPDPNNPEDYHEKVRQSLWAFKTGSFPDTVH
jgi:hypothetical protein